MQRFDFSRRLGPIALALFALASCTSSPRPDTTSGLAQAPVSAVAPSGAPEAPPAAEPLDTARLQNELVGLQTRQTPRGAVVTIGNVLFKTNSAELTAEALASLDRLAGFLKESPASTVQVEGYTDSSRSPDYNVGLSQRRADSVRSALVARGVDPGRIEARGYGQAAPVASNDTAQGRQMNRRVEIVIGGPGGAPPQASGTIR